MSDDQENKNSPKMPAMGPWFTWLIWVALIATVWQQLGQESASVEIPYSKFK